MSLQLNANKPFYYQYQVRRYLYSQNFLDDCKYYSSKQVYDYMKYTEIRIAVIYLLSFGLPLEIVELIHKISIIRWDYDYKTYIEQITDDSQLFGLRLLVEFL